MFSNSNRAMNLATLVALSFDHANAVGFGRWTYVVYPDLSVVQIARSMDKTILSRNDRSVCLTHSRNSPTGTAGRPISEPTPGPFTRAHVVWGTSMKACIPDSTSLHPPISHHRLLARAASVLRSSAVRSRTLTDTATRSTTRTSATTPPSLWSSEPWIRVRAIIRQMPTRTGGGAARTREQAACTPICLCGRSKSSVGRGRGRWR